MCTETHQPGANTAQSKMHLNQSKDPVAETQEVAHTDQPNPDIAHALRTRLAVITLLSGNLDMLYERLEDEKRRKMIRDLRLHTRSCPHPRHHFLRCRRLRTAGILLRPER